MSGRESMTGFSQQERNPLRPDASIDMGDWELVAARLPYGVFSEHAVLGASVAMKMKDLPGRLLLPKERDASDSFRLRPPSMWGGHPEHSQLAEHWGYSNGPSLATVQTVVLHIDHTYFEDGRPTYSTGFPKQARKWVVQLCDWLAVLAGGTTDLVAQDTLTWQNWDIHIEAVGEGQGDWLEPDYALSLDQWRFAVDKASSGESAPFPLALIAAAQRSAAEGDYRRAVFDAASAAETALREALESALEPEGISSAFYGWAMKGKTFGPLVDVCQKVGLTLPEDTMGRLIRTRNRVTHHSDIPDDAEMIDAVAVAGEIVRRNYQIDPSLRAAMDQGPQNTYR